MDALPISPARLAKLMADLRPDADAAARVPKSGCVEGAIGTAVQGALYYQDRAEPDPLHVAAFLLRSLAQNHCYQDGNKRIAWLAMLDVLWVHASLAIDADQEEAAAVVNQVATRQCSIEDLIVWLADHLVPAA